ncbi:MAG: tRNA uridine-5-carboxymethylaminomethyl(34) synthesis GTPase MnmE [Octadecabacter sp.]|nr:tRNA uridine-5-carboxymethylaminomethyl(34) synthesis GTPase MnmE [Octadecabacter sp.]
MDTIFALATAAGKSGVAVIRVSGPDVLAACQKLGVQIGPHDRRLCNVSSLDGSLIDQAFVLSFAEGHSFTGEQVVELQTHGSMAIVSAVLSALSDVGLRPAEAGEFTRRALDNGMLDLARVEGLADLIDAETEAQRRQAIRVFKGELGDLVEGWRVKLIRAAALLEATIDFVDEDVPVDVYPEVRELLSDVAKQVDQEAAGVKVRERIRDGFEVALVGPPNSGKSTLLNRLAGREAAITSEIAGTTRDVIEVRMDLGGLPVTILDTAGLRDSDDILEEIGIERGRQRAEAADLRIHLSADPDLRNTSTDVDIFVHSKSDLHAPADGALNISALTGAGVDALTDLVASRLSGLATGGGIATRLRHQEALLNASENLKYVLLNIENADFPVDLLAEDLRTAIRSLDVLVGRIDVENVLGEIFASFCIGK